MATVKGQNLRVLVGVDTEHLQCIAASTNSVLHCALQVDEDTTKDTTDDWIEREPVGLNWDVQVDALVVTNDDQEYLPGACSIGQLQIGRVYKLQFSRTAGAAGEQNRDVVDDAMQFTGDAILSDIHITSQNVELAIVSAKFTGTGELTQYEEE